MRKNRLHALLALTLTMVILFLVGCHLVFPGHTSWYQPTYPCYYFSAQFYRPLPGGQEFTENWCMYGWPAPVPDQTPDQYCSDYCYEKLGHYLQHSMSPYVGWNVRNISWVPVSRNQAADCATPSSLPAMWGGPIGAKIGWINPPTSEADVYVTMVDKDGQTRTASPTVKTAYIDVAERTGMPQISGGLYILGQKHARFTDMYLELSSFSLGDMQVDKCYIQSIGGVIAVNEGGIEKVYPGNAKFFFHGEGNIGANNGTTNFCFTNLTPQGLQLHQGPGMTMFTMALNLLPGDIGEQMQIRVTLVKPWSQPSLFWAHQPYIVLSDKTVTGPNVTLAADEIGDMDNDLQKVLWFRDFESSTEQFLGAGTSCAATLPFGWNAITCVAYDSRGAYATSNMNLLVSPPNDTCANAQTVLAGLTWGDNTGATTDGVASCADSHADVWFRYVARGSGGLAFATVSTCDAGGTLADTVLSVHGACGTSGLVCGDDGCGEGNRRSTVRIMVHPRDVLLIRVASYGTSGPMGTFPLWIEETPVATGDVNTDGCVDVVDLLYLIDAFGTYPGAPKYNPACDFNHDNAVDVLDLLDMISNFGTCVS